MMKTDVYPDYETMSSFAAELIIEYVNRNPNALISFAAGSSPLKTFYFLVKASLQGRVNFKQCHFVSLDEWVGLNGSDEGSCFETLNTHFFKPLGISELNIHFFDGTSVDLEDECRKMDRFILLHERIDLFLLGIGLNGHLGFNEPGVSFDQYSHLSDLDPVTKDVSVKYFKQQKDLKQGITLGIKHMLEAETVILIADGSKKADIIKTAIHGEITNRVPASILQKHANFHLFLDEQAASKLI